MPTNMVRGHPTRALGKIVKYLLRGLSKYAAAQKSYSKQLERNKKGCYLFRSYFYRFKADN